MYAWEQFHRATLTLVQPGSIKQRLVTAYTENLIDLTDGDLPKDIHGDFRSMNQELTRVKPYGKENPVSATVRKMSDREAGQWAAKIVHIYDALSQSFGKGSTLVINGAAKNGHNGTNGQKHQIHAA